jgi:hypothetical protein
MSDAVLLDILAGRKRALELLLTGDPFAPAIGEHDRAAP